MASRHLEIAFVIQFSILPRCHGQLTKPIRHNLLNSASFGPQFQYCVDSDIGDCGSSSFAQYSSSRHPAESAWCVFVDRDENGRKQSAKDSTIFTFIFFYRKRKRYGIFRNRNDAGIPVISKTEIYGREHIDNGRNSSKRYLKTINISNNRA